VIGRCPYCLVVFFGPDGEADWCAVDWPLIVADVGLHEHNACICKCRGYSQQMRDSLNSDTGKVGRREMPRGITAVGVFLFFGATMASFAGATLTWPGTSFDRIWALNPSAHKQLVRLGEPAGILFLLLSATLAAAGTGWFKRRLWGWRLAVAIIATQVLGDLINFFKGDWLRGSVGFSIATALLVYLLRPAVRAVFSRAILP